jgi:hypothetical protein
MPLPAKHVQPLHFEDFAGAQFERLVFAYHARTEKWRSLEWYGQVGSDLGPSVRCISCHPKPPTSWSVSGGMRSDYSGAHIRHSRNRHGD